MRISRKGESLWHEWAGEGYYLSSPFSVAFYTIEHVDLDLDIVRRALASAIQRDGLVDSLGQAFALIEKSTISQGYAGELDGDLDLTFCDADGETYYGDHVAMPDPITWVEVHNVR